MKAIETKAQVNADCTLTITMQVPADVPVGEYEAMVVLNRLAGDESANGSQSEATLKSSQLSASLQTEKWGQETANAWEEIQAEVRETKKEPQPVQNEYHRALIEKYRKQGLDL